MENVAQFALHGRYVGPGHTGAPRLGEENYSTAPVDELDNAARSHDWAYKQHPGAAGKTARSEADFILAKRAARAASGNSGWAHAKSLFVSAGMYAKGLIDRNGGEETFIFDPISHRSWQNMRPDQRRVGVTEQINGNNGSATNSDDVKGMRGRQGPPAQSGRLSGPSRGQQKQVPRSKGDGGAGYPTLLPVVSQVPQLEKMEKVRGVRVQITSAIVAPASIIAPGEVIFSTLADRSMFLGTPLEKTFQKYDSWRCYRMDFDAVPALATNTAGLGWVLPDPDSQDVQPIGIVKGDSYFAGHKNAKQHSVFGAPWKTTMVCSGQQLFTDLAFSQSRNAGTTPDVRNSAAGALSFATSTGFTSTSTNMASMWATVWADFYNPADTEDDWVPLMVKAQSLNGTIQAASVTLNTANLLAVVGGAGLPSSSSNTYTEYAYLDAYVTGTGIQLPVGYWLLKTYYGLGAAPGNTTVNLNIGAGAVQSNDLNSITVSAFTEAPEFVSAPAALVAPVAAQYIQGTIRVTAPSTGSNYLTINPVFTMTNSVSVTTVIIMVLRLPTNVANPFSTHFPLGNSGGTVQVTTTPQERANVVRYKCQSQIAPPISLTAGEYQQFVEYRARQAARTDVAIVDDQKSTQPTGLASVSSYFYSK